jgi:hypothetical protein
VGGDGCECEDRFNCDGCADAYYGTDIFTLPEFSCYLHADGKVEELEECRYGESAFDWAFENKNVEEIKLVIKVSN